MTRIQLPDPVAVWETDEEYEFIDSSEMKYTVRAKVGDTVIFERIYRESEGRGVYDLAEAQERAANELGERLRALLEGEAA